MMPPTKKLFHAVVVTGAALTGGCQPQPVQEITIQPLDGPPDAQTATNASATSAVDTTSTVHVTPIKTSTGTTVLRRVDGGCPADSELAYPPCYYIR